MTSLSVDRLLHWSINSSPIIYIEDKNRLYVTLFAGGSSINAKLSTKNQAVETSLCIWWNRTITSTPVHWYSYVHSHESLPSIIASRFTTARGPNSSFNSMRNHMHVPPAGRSALNSRILGPGITRWKAVLRAFAFCLKPCSCAARRFESHTW